MNTVPFDQLGPGQSGRLAFQVLGQDGPIFNPQNIRYLSPDSPEIPALPGAGASGLAVGLSGVGLISSFLNLGISAYIAGQVRALHDKLDDLEEMMEIIERKIDYIVKKVDRIDTQVAENNLRHALEYALQKAVSKERIDLSVLAVLVDDFEKFNESFSDFPILNFGLRLSSDICGRLKQICDLAYRVRTLVAHRHNASVDGDPERIITVNPIDDYFLYFGGDLRTHVKATLHLEKEAIKRAEWLDFDDYLSVSRTKLFPEDYKVYHEGFRYARAAGIRILPPASKAVKDPKGAEQNLYNLVVGWLYNTDSGLLSRAWWELKAISDGYEKTFWPKLAKAESCGFDQIDIVCDLPLLENS